MMPRIFLIGLCIFGASCIIKSQHEKVNTEEESLSPKITAEDNYEYALSELSVDQKDFIKQNLVKAKDFVSKYAETPMEKSI